MLKSNAGQLPDCCPHTDGRGSRGVRAGRLRQWPRGRQYSPYGGSFRGPLTCAQSPAPQQLLVLLKLRTPVRILFLAGRSSRRYAR